MSAITCYFIGIAIGILLAVSIRRFFLDGELKIDQSDPENVLMRFDFSKNPNAIEKKKFIFFKVNNKADLRSQK